LIDIERQKLVREYSVSSDVSSVKWGTTDANCFIASIYKLQLFSFMILIITATDGSSSQLFVYDQRIGGPTPVKLFTSGITSVTSSSFRYFFPPLI
jgi:hypothetical protein